MSTLYGPLMPCARRRTPAGCSQALGRRGQRAWVEAVGGTRYSARHERPDIDEKMVLQGAVAEVAGTPDPAWDADPPRI